MTADEVRSKYLKFFEDRGHKVIHSASLVPQNDPSVLFTTAGMHPLVPYLLGETHPMGKRLVDIQKCLRTDDIDEVGDFNHHTFFEMLGNWSLGDYFKKEAIAWSYEFLTKELGLDPQRLFITCFAGDQDAPKDEESAAIWKSLGIPEKRIFFFGKKDNWWGPAGLTGPCGPDTEMHYDVTQKPHGPDCVPGCSCGRFSEIWNNVFMEYNKKSDGSFEKLPKPNVDTGMGFERTLAVVNDLTDDYETELWLPVVEKITEVSGKTYKQHLKPFRIIADHIRASVFAINDGVVPSNKLQGYILRRLIRRTVLQLNQLGIKSYEPIVLEIADIFVSLMARYYPELKENQKLIHQVLQDEVQKFEKTLEKGLKEAAKITEIDGTKAFDLYQTYGFPLELSIEIFSDKGQEINKSEFQKEFDKHKDKSRTASGGMFKGGLADHSEETTKLHTATHLLHTSLRKILGEHVQQKGSNITHERLRFDFTHPQKLTAEEIKNVEDLVNQQIVKDLPVKFEIKSLDEALKEGALAFFGDKYQEKVKVYSIGDFSKEVCGGPHIEHTGALGKFKIIKEESASSGVRRIYATFDVSK